MHEIITLTIDLINTKCACLLHSSQAILLSWSLCLVLVIDGKGRPQMAFFHPHCKTLSLLPGCKLSYSLLSLTPDKGMSQRKCLVWI